MNSLKISRHFHDNKENHQLKQKRGIERNGESLPDDSQNERLYGGLTEVFTSQFAVVALYYHLHYEDYILNVLSVDLSDYHLTNNK
jgi:hypothetical protein